MSNVLIGIIGVILFVGLALAGASYLGKEFGDASAKSQAAAISSVMQQTAHAATMYQAKRGIQLTGADGPTIVQRLVDSKTLKEYPRNIVNPGNPPIGANINGNHRADLPLRLFYMDLGDSEEAREVCRAIERISGGDDADQVVDNLNPFRERSNSQQRQGCIWNSSYYDRYVAYIMI
ncbi:MAG: hypothetical protein CL472_08220 [Acidobacteria bacterium]|nr:hypothetical protein [Acidobacteriota bacterium]